MCIKMTRLPTELVTDAFLNDFTVIFTIMFVCVTLHSNRKLISRHMKAAKIHRIVLVRICEKEKRKIAEKCKEKGKSIGIICKEDDKKKYEQRTTLAS